MPRFTCVSVPSQRSVTVQTVPRTVALEFRPVVRNRPETLERRRRRRRRESAADAERPPFLPQRLKFPPLQAQVGEAAIAAGARLTHLEQA